MFDTNILWVERYRPHKIADCILPQALKTTFEKILLSGEIPNHTFAGSAGTGKTTVARALCDELGADYLLINGSKDGNIDTLRTKIEQYVSTVSLTGRRKVVILDEADYVNIQSTQPALRGFIEKFSSNAAFILTANFQDRIMGAIKSRCPVIEFKIPTKERKKIASQFLKRLEMILTAEKIKYDPAVLAEFIISYLGANMSPDFRVMIGELQRYARNGPIDQEFLATLGDVAIIDLVAGMRAKDFSKVRKWVTDNLDNDPTRIFRKIYDSLYEHFSPTSIPGAVLVLAEYQHKAVTVADQEINLAACFVQLMIECEFK